MAVEIKNGIQEKLFLHGWNQKLLKIVFPAVERKKVAEKSETIGWKQIKLFNIFTMAVEIKNIFQEKLFFSGWTQKVVENFKLRGWKKKCWKIFKPVVESNFFLRKQVAEKS